MPFPPDDEKFKKLGEQARRALEEMNQQFQKTYGPFVDEWKREEEDRARRLAPMLEAFNRAEEQHREAMAPMLAALDAAIDVGPPDAIARAITGLTAAEALSKPLEWEAPAAAAIEKIKDAGGGLAEKAKGELALELARGVADATKRMIAAGTENRIAVVQAIRRLVRSSDNNTKTMSRLAAANIALTVVIALATVAGVWVAWHTGPARVEVNVPAPVVNVQPAISPTPPLSAPPSPVPKRSARRR